MVTVKKLTLVLAVIAAALALAAPASALPEHHECVNPDCSETFIP